MNLKIYDVTPEGEARIIDFLDKVFSQADDIERDVVIRRPSSYIRARSNSLEYRIDAGYRLLAFPVSIEQIKEVFLFYYRHDGVLLCNLDWKQSARWKDGTCFVPFMKSARNIDSIPEANPDSIPEANQDSIPDVDQIFIQKVDPIPVPETGMAYFDEIDLKSLMEQNGGEAKKSFNWLWHSLWIIPLTLICAVFYIPVWIIKTIFSIPKWVNKK